MFGFEFQTNGNLFLSGVRERDTAWTHDGGLLTLEGDETSEHPELSELEFVTKPCPDLQVAQAAITVAQKLAEQIEHDSRNPANEMSFKKGDPYLGGHWNCTGKIQLGNRTFEAKPQVTVGIPLASLIDFFSAALKNIGSSAVITTMEEMGGAAYTMLQHMLGGEPPPDLLGFVCACHYLVLGASNKEPILYAVDPTGHPVGSRDRHDSWRIFQLDSEYLYNLQGFRAGDRPTCKVLVNSDSPKSSFGILHRTDFYSMYRLIPPEQRPNIPTADWINVLWPYDLSQPILFPVPYRAEPVDPRYPQGPVEREGRGWDDEFGKSAGKTVRWSLMEHGPTLSEWWASVVNGRPEPGQPANQPLPKDLASPPPGLQGRARAVLADFPTKDEDKRSFYSMGAFPADLRFGKKLAVYEFRALSSDQTIRDLLTPRNLAPATEWGKVVERFCHTYVKF